MKSGPNKKLVLFPILALALEASFILLWSQPLRKYWFPVLHNKARYLTKRINSIGGFGHTKPICTLTPSWSKTYGGPGGYSSAEAISITSDCGYVVAGWTWIASAGAHDFWILKLNATGEIIWQNTYGTEGYDEPKSIQQTKDGGYIVAGSGAFSGQTSIDPWIIKLDSKGQVVWQKTVAGIRAGLINCIRETSDSRYIASGVIMESGKGGWIIKLDGNGEALWQKSLGGGAISSIQEIDDGGYIAVGSGSSVIKLNSDGIPQWRKNYGPGYLTSIQETIDGGYIIAGDRRILRINEYGGIKWQRNYLVDEITSIQETSDQGFILAGFTQLSKETREDAWVLKLDKEGQVLFEKAYGGKGEDKVRSIQENFEGGYIFTGETNSFGSPKDVWIVKIDQKGNISEDCPISKASQAKASDSTAQIKDIAVSAQDLSIRLKDTTIKSRPTSAISQTQCPPLLARQNTLEACNGTGTWAKTFHLSKSGEDEEFGKSIQETSDGGFIAAGEMTSWRKTEPDEEDHAGLNQDIWAFKMDPDGHLLWQKAFDGDKDDHLEIIRETTDHGYILAGVTESFGAGKKDAWILKLDHIGQIEWQKTYGGKDDDDILSVLEIPGNGFIFAGWTKSFGAGNTDAWVLKADDDGKVAWQKTYGGKADDNVNSISRTKDGGYIMVAYSDSFQDKTWVLKLDKYGKIEWQRSYGGDGGARFIYENETGGYFVGGTGKYSEAKGDFTLMKLDTNGSAEWLKAYGGPSLDYLISMNITSDHGYILAGRTMSFGIANGDGLILKLDENGKVEWQKTYGGSQIDEIDSINQLSGGGYIAAGLTGSFGSTMNSLIMKLNNHGEISGDCILGKPVSVSISESSVPVNETSIIPKDSQAVITETQVIPEDTMAVIKP